MYCRKSERYQVKKIDCNVCDHIFSGHVFISELNHITSYFSWSSNYYVHTLFFTLSFGPYYADNWIINQRESWFCVFIFILFIFFGFCCVHLIFLFHMLCIHALVRIFVTIDACCKNNNCIKPSRAPQKKMIGK